MVFTVALLTGTDLPYALAATVRSSAGQIIRPAHLLAAAALFMVILHETGRIRVETHTGTNEYGRIEEARAFETPALPRAAVFGRELRAGLQVPLELLVATILSAQTTDKRVKMVTPTLFARYLTTADYAAGDRDELEKIIQSTGFYHAKANSLLGLGQAPLRPVRRGGSAAAEGPGHAARRGPQDGERGARNAFGIPGITVDRYFGRLARRFGWTTETDPVKVEAEVATLIPRKEWTILSHRLIWHGRRVCHAASRPAARARWPGSARPSERGPPIRRWRPSSSSPARSRDRRPRACASHGARGARSAVAARAGGRGRER